MKEISKTKMKSDWQVKEQSVPYHKSVVELFEAQSSETPHNCAVIHGELELSYLELNNRSNQLANLLKRKIAILGKRSTSQMMVGICMERSIDMLVSIIAILKVGAAYVPIDPGYPIERLKYILNDTQLDLLLTQDLILESKLCMLEPAFQELIIPTDNSLIKKELIQQPTCHFQTQKQINNLIYIIYTSGSTGYPKGVLINQKNVLNYSFWVYNYLGIHSSERFDCSSSLSFDFTVTTTLVPLLFGATVVLCDENIKADPAKYLYYLDKYRINIIKLVPTYFNLLVDLNKDNTLSSLRSVILGGENASMVHIRNWLSCHQEHVILNEYGPTETTVGVTLAQYSYNDLEKDITIGVAGFNTRTYVLDEKMQVVEEGDTGELYISGDCVSRGYLNRPELTQTRFISNPFPSSSMHSVLYKTGDLVRHLPSGELECIGRIDDQVKINGYRIELNEVETLINSHSGINQAIVVGIDNGNLKSLVAYYTRSNNKFFSQSSLKAHLNSLLPFYMVPTYFIELPALPLTINGKIDKAALPNPAFRTKVDEQTNSLVTIKTVLEELLEICDIDIDENFFDLGMNSFKITEFHSHLEQKGIELTLLMLFQYPTVRLLNNLITSSMSKQRHTKLNHSKDRRRNARRLDVMKINYAKQN